MIGHRFTRLLVVSQTNSVKVGIKRVSSRRAYVCRCDCGAEIVVTSNNLKTGNSKSCGCFKADATHAAKFIHGRNASDPTYSSWTAMHSRCSNTRREKYERYGGRGISVCDRWGEFEKFLADMGERPSGMTLDRIDVDGNYEPDNCRWATPSEQARNKSTNRFVEINGSRMILEDAAQMHGMLQSTLHKRLARGMSIEEAVLK
jgi:hypothetical protein